MAGVDALQLAKLFSQVLAPAVLFEKQALNRVLAESMYVHEILTA
jgi:hypothetical protein